MLEILKAELRSSWYVIIILTAILFFMRYEFSQFGVVYIDTYHHFSLALTALISYLDLLVFEATKRINLYSNLPISKSVLGIIRVIKPILLILISASFYIFVCLIFNLRLIELNSILFHAYFGLGLFSSISNIFFDLLNKIKCKDRVFGLTLSLYFLALSLIGIISNNIFGIKLWAIPLNLPFVASAIGFSIILQVISIITIQKKTSYLSVIMK